MIHVCVAALSAFTSIYFNNGNIGGTYEIKNCVFNSEKMTGWIEYTWKFDEKDYSGTLGRTTVNYRIGQKCHLPRTSETYYLDDMNQKFSPQELLHLSKYRLYVKNVLRYFMSEYCWQNKDKK
jgi:hypothetical protein